MFFPVSATLFCQMDGACVNIALNLIHSIALKLIHPEFTHTSAHAQA